MMEKSYIEKALDKIDEYILDDCVRNQTDLSFFEQCSQKDLYVIGMGMCFSIFAEVYGSRLKIKGLIDENSELIGCRAGDVLPVASRNSMENLIIHDYEYIKKLNKDNVVLLVTSFKYFNEIYSRLKEMGFRECFSLLSILRNAEKKVLKWDYQKKKTEYIEKCKNLPVNNKKIVVSYGSYGGHGKEISLELIRRSDLDIVWIVNDISIKAPRGVRKILFGNWANEAFELSTASVWIFDTLVPLWMEKKEGQIYIQVKHWSSITLKRFYFQDYAVCNNPVLLERTKKNVNMFDYIMVGSDFDEASCREGFMYDGPYVRVGSPRSDALFRIETRDNVRKKLHIGNSHVVLYAPTYREGENEDNLPINLLDHKEIIKTLKSKFGGEWIFMVKLHPTTASKCELKKSDLLIDMTRYEDIEELVSISDILISDYSSVMFESAYIHKPVFLFSPDKEQYIDKERELLLEYDSLPFSCGRSSAQIIEFINEFDQVQYEKKVSDFLNKYGVHEDGHASERAASFILTLLEEKVRKLLNNK